MKKSLKIIKPALFVIALLSLGLITSGCMVRTHGRVPVAAIHGPRVVVSTPTVRVRSRTCYRKQCHRECGLFGCRTHCHRVAYRCR